MTSHPSPRNPFTSHSTRPHVIGKSRAAPSVCVSFAAAHLMQAPVPSLLPRQTRHSRVSLKTIWKFATPSPLASNPSQHHTRSSSNTRSPYTPFSGSLLLHSLPHILTANLLTHSITAHAESVSMRSITTAAAVLASMTAVFNVQSSSAGMFIHCKLTCSMLTVFSSRRYQCQYLHRRRIPPS